MKALQVDTYGDPSHFSIHTNVQIPGLKPNQLRIAVKAASINPFDITVSSGVMKDMMPLTLPYTIGGDFSGVVEEIGGSVTGFVPGDEVFGQAVVLNGGSGSFAEHVIANAANIAHKPKMIDFLAAASLPLAGSSAVQALEEHIKLSKSQHILIHGGAGGIGSLAIQIAKVHGAYVATTASGEGLAFVKSLGADEVIDYKTQKFEELIKDYDAVFDTVGGQTTNASLSVLKKGGILVTMIGQPDETKAASLGVTAIRQMTKTTTEHLSRLAQLIDEGHIKPVIDKVMPFMEAREAFTYFIEGHPKGKVVINISG